jgi:hypothetical protein
VASRSLTSIITPGYAPFEQYHTSGAQGPWTDLYALAGVLYWLVTGHKPVEAPGRVKEDTMTPAIVAGAGRYSSGFLAAIDWALRVDEDARPRSVADFRRALLGEAPVPSGTGAPAATPPAGGRRARLVGVVAAVVLLAGLGIFVLTRTGAPPVPPALAPPAEAVAAPPPAALPAAEAPRSESRAADGSPPQSRQKSAGAEAAAPPAGGSATLLFQIVPPGEPAVVFIDGRKVGNSPALTEYRVAPGRHKVEIRGNRKPWTHHFWVNLKPGEKKKIWARFADES